MHPQWLSEPSGKSQSGPFPEVLPADSQLSLFRGGVKSRVDPNTSPCSTLPAYTELPSKHIGDQAHAYTPAKPPEDGGCPQDKCIVADRLVKLRLPGELFV